VDDARVLLSALEPNPEGGARVRIWNASPDERRVNVRVASSVTLRPVDLRDAPAERSAAASGSAIEMTLRPYEIATILAA
jgi:hypothetical protein